MNRLINTDTNKKVNDKSNMWWVFTLNNGLKLKEELERIENKKYELHVREYSDDELTMEFEGPDNESIEIDIHSLSMNIKNLPLNTAVEFAQITQERLVKTTLMLKSIGR